MDNCPLCGGKRHVRRDGRWLRCVCMATSLSTSFVHPVLRGSDTSVPPIYFEREPLPMRTYVAVNGDPCAGGNWEIFRRQAWRSLLAYEPQGITHDVVFFNRFSDIVTGREQPEDGDVGSDGHYTVRDLVRLDVLVIVISAYDITNRLTRSVFGNLLDERENANRATWVFSHVSGFALRNLLDEPIYRRWFASSDAHPAPVAIHPPAGPERSGTGAAPESAHPARGGGARRYR